MPSNSPLTIVRSQLDAYNAKDLEALLRTYAVDAEQFALHGERLAHGRPELRARFAVRLAEPEIHAKLLSRIVMGNVVTDHELVTRNFPEGRGSVEMLCIYEVLDGHIQKATFAMGEKRLDAETRTKVAVPSKPDTVRPASSVDVVGPTNNARIEGHAQAPAYLGPLL